MVLSLRRSSGLQELAIQVGTPNRGSTQRIVTRYAIKNVTNQTHSGMTLSPLQSQAGIRAFQLVVDAGGRGLDGLPTMDVTLWRQ